MTEAEWLACSEPLVLLAFLRREAPALIDRAPPERRDELRRHLLDTLTPRRLGLVACACCRVLLPVLGDERSIRAVEVTERYLDGGADEVEWGESREAATAATHAIRPRPGGPDRAWALVRRVAALAAVRAACL